MGALSLRSGPPAVFLVLGLGWLALDAVLLALLWLPATSATSDAADPPPAAAGSSVGGHLLSPVGARV